MRRLFDLLSDRQRDLYTVSPRHSRQKPRQDYRNGYYGRDFVTRLGTLRLRIARTRKRGFLPGVLHAACAGKKAPIYRGPERSFCTRDPRILGPRDQLSNQVGENQN
jgi:hypothetical protein